jgi:2-methylcitrate dehydratase PrpD
LPDRLLDGLGEGGSAYAELSAKPFCSAKQAIAATEAFQDLLCDGLAPQEASRIVVRVPPAYAKMIERRPESGSRSSTFASVRYQMALAAYAPEGLYEIGRDEARVDERMSALMNRIEIVADEGLAPYYPKAWPASVAVETAAGWRERMVVHALGDPSRRLSGDALLDKARRVLGSATADLQAHIDAAARALDQPEAAQRFFDLFRTALSA